MTRLGRLGQRLDLVAVMLTVIIAGVVGFVGISVMQSTNDQTALQGPYDTNTTDNVSTPSPGTGDTFYDSSQNFTDGLEGFFGQVGTVFTVIVLVVIVSYLTLLRGR